MTALLSGPARARITRSGYPSFSCAEGLEMLEAALGGVRGQVMALKLDQEYLTGRTKEQMSPLLHSLGSFSSAQQPTLLQELDSLSGPRLVERLRKHVGQAVGQVLGCDPSWQPDPELDFFDMGIDSLMALEVRNNLRNTFNCTLSPAFLFDYSTPEELAIHLAQLLEQGGANETVVRAGAVFHI